jgi:hypothetical protein
MSLTGTNFGRSTIEVFEKIQKMVEGLDVNKIISESKRNDHDNVQACFLVCHVISRYFRREGLSVRRGYFIERGRKISFCWLETADGNIIVPILPKCQQKNGPCRPIIMTKIDAIRAGYAIESKTVKQEMNDCFCIAAGLVNWHCRAVFGTFETRVV